MPHPTLLSTDESILVVIDIQEKLLPAIHGGDAVVENAARLILGAALLSVPIVVSEQYAKGLGGTVEPIREALDQAKAAGADVTVLDKTTFACTGSDAFLDALEEHSREQVVLAGIETHICVLQTALDLVEEGSLAYVVGDAVGSRAPENRELALARMRQAGVIVPATESVLYEWVGDAAHAQFKAVCKLVK